MSLHHTLYRRLFGAASQTEQIAAQTAGVLKDDAVCNDAFLPQAQAALAQRLAVEKAWLCDTARLDAQAPVFWLMTAMSGAVMVLTGGVFALVGAGAWGIAAATGGAVLAGGGFYRARELASAQQDVQRRIGSVYERLLAEVQGRLDRLAVATRPAGLCAAFHAAVAQNQQDIAAARRHAAAQSDEASYRAAAGIAGAVGISCTAVLGAPGMRAR